MGFSSVNNARAAVGNGFTRSQLVQLIPPGSSSSLVNYLAFALNANYSKSQIASGANYLSYVENFGFTTYFLNNQYYATKTYTSGTSDSLTPFQGSYASVLSVGGGGGGASGGGGGGGVLYTPSFLINGTQTVTIGAGGSGAGPNNGQRGSDGVDTVFGTLVAGGGGGGSGYETSARPGRANNGNGGGTGVNGGTAAPGGAGSGLGNRGGNTTANVQGGAGGGGAGAAGGDNSGINSGGKNGGIGLAYDITGTSIFYSGGGGGGPNAAGGNTPGLGGTGGGGNGVNNGNGQNGVNGLGGGGGSCQASSNSATGFVGGSGGSGVVIIRFTLTIPQVFTI
jgi:hypothetical protein